MNIDKKIANKIWKAYFGDVLNERDPFDYKMIKSKYNTKGDGCWSIDHIWPLNSKEKNIGNGADVLENTQPLSCNANQEKDNNLQGKINDITFAVSKIETYNGKKIGRMSIKDSDNKWSWVYNEPKFK